MRVTAQDEIDSFLHSGGLGKVVIATKRIFVPERRQSSKRRGTQAGDST